MMKKLSNLLLLALLMGQAPLSAATDAEETATAAGPTAAAATEDGGGEAAAPMTGVIDAFVMSNARAPEPAETATSELPFHGNPSAELAIAEAEAEAARMEKLEQFRAKHPKTLRGRQTLADIHSVLPTFHKLSQQEKTLKAFVDNIALEGYEGEDQWGETNAEAFTAATGQAQRVARGFIGRRRAARKRSHDAVMAQIRGINPNDPFGKAAAAGATDYGVAHPGGADYNPAQHNAGHEVDPDYPAKPNHWYSWFGDNKMATGGIATGGVAAIAGTSIMSVAFHNHGKTDAQIAAMHPLARWMTTAGLRTAKAMGMKWGRKVADLQEMAEEAAKKMAPAVDMSMQMGDGNPFTMDETSAAA